MTGLLAAVGLGDTDERVYFTVLRQPGITSQLLADIVSVSPERLDRCVRRLQERQLLRRDGSRLVATRPDAAIAALAHRRLAELEELRLQGEQLSDAYRRSLPQQRRMPLVEAISMAPTCGERTFSGINVLFDRLMAETQSELLGFDLANCVSGDKSEIRAEAPVLARGVTIRALYESPSLLVPGRLPLIRRLADMGEQSRIYPKLPLQLYVFDRRVAMLPLTANLGVPHCTGIVVHDPQLLRLLVALFDAYWERATPLQPVVDAGPPSDEDRPLLMLLAAGLKDELIAAELGLSIKTTRRRISRTLARLGVSTRFQAGVEASRRGWV